MPEKSQLMAAINRIVIGDVGSGKTIVAFLIALTFMKGLDEAQAAMLAPTEVLAFQHYQNLLKLKQNNPKLLNWLEIVFLSGKQIFWNEEKLTKGKLAKLLAEKENNSILKQSDRVKKVNGKNPVREKVKLKNEKVSTDISQKNSKIFWIGTQALLFHEEVKPDLVLVDEQHRFGVKQRQLLSSKKYTESGIFPHFISFTATPIPRTLALTVYESLKPVFLEKLKGRNKIETSVSTFDRLEEEVIPIIRNEIEKSRKIYVVCSKVEDKEETDESEMWSVKKALEFLENFFPGQCLLVHGKLAEKKQLLAEFKESKQKNILVATTVIEVGVDVATASLVIILNAERFGLSALHQIRGRVGRNNFTDNKCILVAPKQFSFVRRLRYLSQFQDGFQLAEKDLELRGGGDLLGTSQSGFDTEINNLIGLQPELYFQLSQLVSGLDLHNLRPELKRLENYLEKESQKIWNE